jgi:hypothetical protein
MPIYHLFLRGLHGIVDMKTECRSRVTPRPGVPPLCGKSRLVTAVDVFHEVFFFFY